MVEKKKEPSAPTTAPKVTRKGKSLTVWIPEELFDAMKTYQKEDRLRPSNTAIVILSLEDFLKEKGYYPPKKEK